MRRYNRLVRLGYQVVTVDRHMEEGSYYTNVLMGKGLERKTVRLRGYWQMSSLTESIDA